MTITRKYYEELIKAYENSRPMKPIKEELGGGYYYRCPWLTCNSVLRSDWSFCAYCGQKIKFPLDDYKGD